MDTLYILACAFVLSLNSKRNHWNNTFFQPPRGVANPNFAVVDFTAR